MTFELWKRQLLELAGLLLAPPGSVGFWILLAVGGLVCLATMFFSSNLLRIPGTTWDRSAGMLVLAVAILVATAVAARIYLAPRAAGTLGRALATAGPVTAVFLLAVVPLQCGVHRAHYIESLASLAISFVAAALAVVVLRAALFAVHSEMPGVNRLRRHNAETRSFIE